MTPTLKKMARSASASTTPKTGPRTIPVSTNAAIALWCSRIANPSASLATTRSSPNESSVSSTAPLSGNSINADYIRRGRLKYGAGLSAPGILWLTPLSRNRERKGLDESRAPGKMQGLLFVVHTKEKDTWPQGRFELRRPAFESTLLACLVAFVAKGLRLGQTISLGPIPRVRPQYRRH